MKPFLFGLLRIPVLSGHTSPYLRIGALSPERFIVPVITLVASVNTLWAAPSHIYLTWQGEPSTSVTVNYHTLEGAEASEVRFDRESRGGEFGAYRFRIVGSRHRISGLEDGRTIHVVELTGLEPDKAYFFIAGDETNGFSTELKFRTVPDDDRPVRFVVGGDMGINRRAAQLIGIAGEKDPLFAVIGGDLAYANGRLSSHSKWDRWLANWQENFVSPDGFMIPMVLAVGNHEVRGGYGQLPVDAPFYFGYFKQAGGVNRAYFSMRFGANVAIYVLDSGHVSAHGGDQALWLEGEMARDENVPYRLAVYHVPLYPAAHPFGGEYHSEGRKQWLPIFDRYRLTVAFENHDHVLKRTFPLRSGERDGSGTVYLGDGCFGRRTHKLRERDYLAFSRQIRHFWIVEATRERITFKAIDEEGRVVDRYSIQRGER